MATRVISTGLLLVALCAASPLMDPQLESPPEFRPKVLSVLRNLLYPELEARGLLQAVRSHALHIHLGHGSTSIYSLNTSHIIVQAAAPEYSGQQPHELLHVLGRLLQHLSMSGASRPISVVLPEGPFVTRSHQLGYYFEGRTPEFAQYARELAVFGANQVEFAHWQWGSNSSLGSLNTDCYGGNVSAQVEWSGILDDLGMNVSVWWPVDIYFKDQGKSMEGLVSKMRRIDSLFVPGGDGGMVLSPDEFFPAVEKMAAVVRKYHPGASVWMSAQEYSKTNLTRFMSIASDSIWLTGLAYGPHVIVPFAEFDQMVPEGMPVRQYPDIAHSESAQYEIYQWDPRLAVTHGRTVVNPMPRWFGGIAQLRMNASYESHQAGFGAYSEGISDDLNKAIWSSLYADPARSVDDIVGHFAAYYTTGGTKPAQSAAIVSELIFALEKTFSGGTLEENSANILNALLLANRLQETDPQAIIANWRLEAFVFRALFDSYILLRVQHEDKLISQAMKMLGSEGGAAQGEVSKLVQTSLTGLSATAKGLKKQTLKMAAELGQTLGSPAILQCQVPDLGIPTIDSRISDVQFIQWLAASDLLKRPEVVAALLNYTDPGPGGFYDQAGSTRADDHPRLDQGQGPMADPSSYFTPVQAVQAPKHESNLPFSWFQYAETYYANPLQFMYTGLDLRASYAITVLFHYSDKAAPVRILAGGSVVLKDFFVPTQAPITVSVPRAMTAKHELVIGFNRPAPPSGTGRGGLVAAVWVHRHETVLGVNVLAPHILMARG